jgi:hypothetical protein
MSDTECCCCCCLPLQTSDGANPIRQDELDVKDANGNVTGQEPRYYM